MSQSDFERNPRYYNFCKIPKQYTFGILDTETTGLLTDVSHIYPVQIAVLKITTAFGKEPSKIIDSLNTLIKMDGWHSDPRAYEIHKITEEKANSEGIPIKDALTKMFNLLKDVDTIVCHNLRYDMNDVILPNLKLYGMEEEYNILSAKSTICTMMLGSEIFHNKNMITYIKSGSVGEFPKKVNPKLLDLYKEIVGRDFDKISHDAMNDCLATYKCIDIIIDKYVRFLRTHDGFREILRADNR